MQKQRRLVSEAKFLLRRKEKELADLKTEMYYLEQFILNDKYIATEMKKAFSDNCVKKWEHSKKRKKSKLKAAIDGVREN